MIEPRQSTALPWGLAIGSSLLVGLYGVLDIGRDWSDTRTDESVVLLGAVGVITGFAWLAILEKRNGRRRWRYFLGKAMLLSIPIVLAVLDKLGMLR